MADIPTVVYILIYIYVNINIVTSDMHWKDVCKNETYYSDDSANNYTIGLSAMPLPCDIPNNTEQCECTFTIPSNHFMKISIKIMGRNISMDQYGCHLLNVTKKQISHSACDGIIPNMEFEDGIKLIFNKVKAGGLVNFVIESKVYKSYSPSSGKSGGKYSLRVDCTSTFKTIDEGYCDKNSTKNQTVSRTVTMSTRTFNTPVNTTVLQPKTKPDVPSSTQLINVTMPETTINSTSQETLTNVTTTMMRSTSQETPHKADDKLVVIILASTIGVIIIVAVVIIAVLVRKHRIKSGQPATQRGSIQGVDSEGYSAIYSHRKSNTTPDIIPGKNQVTDIDEFDETRQYAVIDNTAQQVQSSKSSVQFKNIDKETSSDKKTILVENDLYSSG